MTIQEKTDVNAVLKTVYSSLESSLDSYLFEPNPTTDEAEFAIQNVALAFDVPSFVCVTVSGHKYFRGDKMGFIEDMRMHFADNPKFVIDGMFEYKIQPTIAFIDFQMAGRPIADCL